MEYIAEFVMAHGAGQGKDSEFMTIIADLFEQQGVYCRLFNFDYMDKINETGKRRPPDALPKLINKFQSVLDSKLNLPMFIGGKSMGGRVSTLILQESKAIGGICFGYPFHPPGKPEKLRIEHFDQIKKDILILQGERDPFGKPNEIQDYQLAENIHLSYVTDGEHSFKPLKSSTVDWQDNLRFSVEKAADFIKFAIKGGNP